MSQYVVLAVFLQAVKQFFGCFISQAVVAQTPRDVFRCVVTGRPRMTREINTFVVTVQEIDGFFVRLVMDSL